jgi:Ca2+-binding RTX toxin-like protein
VVQGAGSGTYTADHTYASGGVYTVTVTITDDDTGSTNAGTQAVMTGVGINGGVLQIVGTADDDHVEVFIAGGEVDVFASFMEPGHTRFDPADVDSVEIWLCEGDDHGNVHQSITVDAVIHGDDGVDMLWGGDGDDFIEGGDGNDMIWGRRGDDELHGNDGNDRLTGGEGLDILDGGSGTNVLKQ